MFHFVILSRGRVDKKDNGGGGYPLWRVVDKKAKRFQPTQSTPFDVSFPWEPCACSSLFRDSR